MDDSISRYLGEFEEGYFEELTMVWMILFLGIWVNIKLGSELLKGALNGF